MYQDSSLYGWLFTFNHYVGLWSAFKREHLEEAFNNFSSENVIKSRDFEVLQALIGRNNGDLDQIKRLYSEEDQLVVSGA